METSIWKAETLALLALAKLRRFDAMFRRGRKPGPRAWTLVPVALLLMAGAVSAQEVTYYHTDALGSPIAITDAGGSVIERSEYEPYGALLNRQLSDGPGFTGHVADTETGLIYMQQRYQDPAIGIFLSVDPVGADVAPQGQFNRYRYANDNPYKFNDPDGRVVRDPNANDRLRGDLPHQLRSIFELVALAAGGGSEQPPSDSSNSSNKSIFSGDIFGQPFVRDNMLPMNARDILAGHRSLTDSGQVILQLPDSQYRGYPLPRGGGILIVRNSNPPYLGQKIIRSAVRLQPPGTGSWSFNPGGYFVVYNADGQAISPYSGKPMPKEKAHNPISFFVPGED